MYIDTEAANKGGSKPKVTVNSPTRYSEERTPLLETFVGQDAPPSYLEATTPMPWNGRPSGDEASRLLEDGGRPSFAHMSEELHKDGKYRRRSFREHCSRKRMLKWIAAILALIILAAVIAAVTHKNKQVNKSSPTCSSMCSHLQATVSPIPVPAQPAESDAPKPPKSKDNFPIRWPSRCGKDYNVKSEELNWGTPSALKIVEAVHQLDGPYKRVSGWIHVAQAPSDQPAGTIQAKLSYAVSSSVDVDSIKYSYSPNGLTIGDPTFPDGFDGVRKGSACLGISVVIYMAAGAKLENFDIKATHLGMQLHNGVEFSVSDKTSISLTTGTLDAASLNSRETHLETISGSISGRYSLYDLISITTKSGSVNVNIDPKEAAQGGSEPALFLANSLSGSIRADFKRTEIPERDYQVSINTTVGSIDGTFIHGSKTEMATIAGQINADILPFKSGDYASILTTSTTDGQTMLNMRAPYDNPGVAMGKLVSTHKSVSGILNMTYPQEWEGHLEGRSMDGILHIQGRDLELIRQDETPGLNSIEAEKGDGGSSMMFETVSGGCDVGVGKL